MTSSSSSYPIIKGTLVSTESYTWNTADSLGRGASAIVYLGRHKSQGTVVAIKVFHDHVHLANKTEDLREFELLRQLSHRNVIKLLAIETLQNNGKPVLVMEYCEGGSLHHMLDQPQFHYGLCEEEFLLVLRHVSEGMEYLRRENVVHRDIKPGNIMRFITTEGESIYKLTDFGAARNLDEDESFQSLYGTEEYLHPGIYERAVLRLPTDQSFDAKVDLWSLGVTFYHTATGQLPFQPYGGRQNRQTMFEIISQKETGVISGVQSFQGGPITWKRDLPETSPLSSGLRSVVTPILAGLMEPDKSKMISYESLFRMVKNIEQKTVIKIFHYSRCEDLTVYAEPNLTYTGLQDLVASLTDIIAPEQILLVGGKLLEEVVDPLWQITDYPCHLLRDGIYLFEKEISENTHLPKPDIPIQPEFLSSPNIDTDAKLAQTCTARGELIKRYTEKVCTQQDKLMRGLQCLRLYIDSRLIATKASYEYTARLMEESHIHYSTFFQLIDVLRRVLAAKDKSSGAVSKLDIILQDTVIRQVHAKASDRMAEIENYRDMLVKKMDEIKTFASKFSPACKEEKCEKKIQHRMNVITGIYSRFRRDKSVKQQMTTHDMNIHAFERQKLTEHFAEMRSRLKDHCLPHLEKVYRNGVHVGTSLSRCLLRVIKVEKNINSVLNCQQLLSEKLQKLQTSVPIELKAVADSGFASGSSAQLESNNSNSQYATAEMGMAAAKLEDGRSLGSGENILRETSRLSPSLAEPGIPMSDQTRDLEQKLQSIVSLLSENTSILRSLEESTLSSFGSLLQGASQQPRHDPSAPPT